MLTCPHCQQPGITVLRKLFLGPAVPATCKACGGTVGVPSGAMISVGPVVAGIIGASLVGPLWLKIVIWSTGAGVATFIHMKYVPLEKR